MLMSILGPANASACVSHTPCAHQRPLCRREGGKWGTHCRPLMSCISSCASVLLFLKSALMSMRASPVGGAAYHSSWIYYFSLLGWRKSRGEIFLGRWRLCSFHLCAWIRVYLFLPLIFPLSIWTSCSLPNLFFFFFLTGTKSHRYDFPTSFMEVGSWAEQTSIINVSTERKANMGVWPLLGIRKTIEN